MDIFLVVLVLLTLILLSNILNRFIPFISVPLFQIALGAAIDVFPLRLHIPLNPELFLVLFVAPLLFNDGKRIPREELWNLRSPILFLALGLVFATVIVGGYVIHGLIPTIPLPASFALAAILSPTDAVAVGALSSRIRLPKKIVRLLEGEALLNDASGLVAFKFAVAATVTGAFSFADATVDFLIIALGGLAIGIVAAFLLIGFRVYIRRFGMEDITIHMLIQILTPFIIYLAAEHFHMSGILAVVAGGIVHAIARDRSESSMVKLQLVSNSTWSVIVFILNGLVFVILGLQIPAVTGVIFYDVAFSNYQVIGYIFLISFTLIFLRFLWIYFYWRSAYAWSRSNMQTNPSFKDSVLTSLSGVRGAVTLAAAFSIPYMLQDGSPFPQRDLIIFLASGVILVTLITASFVLPLLSKREKEEGVEDRRKMRQAARVAIMHVAMEAVKEEISEENKEASYAVLADYNKQIQLIHKEGTEPNNSPLQDQTEIEIRLKALAAERKEVKRLFEKGLITRRTSASLHRKLDHMETALSGSFQLRLQHLIFRIRRLIFNLFIARTNRSSSTSSLAQELAVLKETKLRTSQAAIEVVRNQIQEENEIVCQAVISSYAEIIDKISLGKSNQVPKDKQFAQHKKEIQLKAIQIERNEVQAQFEKGAISRETANHLRKAILYSEAAMLENNELG